MSPILTYPHLVSLHRGTRNRNDESGVAFFGNVAQNAVEAMAQGFAHAIRIGIVPMETHLLEAVAHLMTQDPAERPTWITRDDWEARIEDPDPRGFSFYLFALPAWHPIFWEYLQYGGQIVSRAVDFDGLCEWAVANPSDAAPLVDRMRHSEDAAQLAEDTLAAQFMKYVEQAPIRAAMADSSISTEEAHTKLRL